ncbi:MAG: tRNA (adenosine(37)-N6)-threonylcarbamoyltransferase complex transferase subunit TsaD [Microgenomates group bacterium]
MKILAIDTSCDETAAAVTEGRRVLSNAIYSQILLHKKWGGVVPSLAKRAHEERIDFVIYEALLKLRNSMKIFPRVNSSPPVGGSSNTHSRQNFISLLVEEIDYIAVTYGPGLAVALEVGIKEAKELAKKYQKKLIAINHMEGHIYSCFVQNRKGNPKVDFQFPYLALLVSGGHTELVIFKGHLNYEVIGCTIDDAAGEALDKAAKLLGLGYPGGPVIERLASQVANQDFHHFPRPMIKSNDLNFSFSGLKTAFYYFLKKNGYLSEGGDRQQKLNVKELASSFQAAVFDSLILKTEKAIKQTGIRNLLIGGGVIANLYLRQRFRQLAKKYHGSILFPPFKYLTGDNAAMIGVAAYYKAQKGIFVEDIESLDRVPRLSL